MCCGFLKTEIVLPRAACLVVVCVLAVLETPHGLADEVTLKFPSEKAVGTVVSSTVTRPVGFGGWSNWYRDSRVQRAIGSVVLPADQFVGLELAGKAAGDLSCLEKIPGGSIEWIEISRVSLGASQLRHLANQTSLKQLTLNSCEISTEALAELEGMLPALENLTIYGAGEDTASHSLFTDWVAQLGKLRRFYCTPALGAAAIRLGTTPIFSQ